MTNTIAIGRSALHHLHVRHGATMRQEDGWEQPWSYADATREAQAVRDAVGMLDESPLGKLAIKGNGRSVSSFAALWPAMPAQPLRAARLEGDLRLVCRLTDDEALVVTAPAGRQALRQHLEEQFQGAGGCLHVVDVTSGQASLRVVGPRARALFRTCTSLDLRERTFPNLACAQASMARVHTLIVRDDLADGLLAYRLFFSRDYAEFVWEWLTEMGHEHGLIPFGQAALRLLEGTTDAEGVR